MTEKRFTIKEIDNFSYGIKVTDIILDNGIELPQSTVCDLLNNLVKENEYLHKYNTNLQKQPLLFDVQTIPNTMEIIEANTKLEEENEQLKQQLYYDGDSVCNICKHQYLVKTRHFYIAKCKKEHEKCSKEDIKYCEDFKFKELIE